MTQQLSSGATDEWRGCPYSQDSVPSGIPRSVSPDRGTIPKLQGSSLLLAGPSFLHELQRGGDGGSGTPPSASAVLSRPILTEQMRTQYTQYNMCSR